MIVNRWRAVLFQPCPSETQTLEMDVEVIEVFDLFTFCSVFKECYCGIDSRGGSASDLREAGRLSSNDTPLRAHTHTHIQPKRAHDYPLTNALLLSLTSTLNYVCECVCFTHSASKSTNSTHAPPPSDEPHRFVSSHVGSLMLFNTLLTTFSRSFRALCSSSSDLFIFLLSCFSS